MLARRVQSNALMRTAIIVYTPHLKQRQLNKFNSIKEWQCFSPKMALFRKCNHIICKSHKYLLSNFPGGVHFKHS